mmetsp:Transcript_13847/g.26066  ORF Transcript_13847/g.26066 Transcript_13847/m.26066 type:complete len:106 (-) Transcript_13847:844-1161(-)
MMIKGYTFLLIMLYKSALLEGVQANNLRTTTWAGHEDNTLNETETIHNASGDPLDIEDHASSEDHETITWYSTSTVKRKLQRRKLRIHKQSAELERLRWYAHIQK